MKEHVLERKPLSISLMTCLLHHSSPTSLLTRPAYGKSGNSTHHGLKHRSTSPASPVPPIYVDVMRGMENITLLKHRVAPKACLAACSIVLQLLPQRWRRLPFLFLAGPSLISAVLTAFSTATFASAHGRLQNSSRTEGPQAGARSARDPQPQREQGLSARHGRSSNQQI